MDRRADKGELPGTPSWGWTRAKGSESGRMDGAGGLLDRQAYA